MVYYTVYGDQEATGFQKLVLIDALLGAEADAVAPGRLGAHEAYHALVSDYFLGNLNEETDYNSVFFSMFYALGNMAEEGVADLIDKDIFSETFSSLQETTVKNLKMDSQAPELIKKLDSTLADWHTRQLGSESFEPGREVLQGISLQGSHIPGRFMAKVIQRAGLLDLLVKGAGYPADFFSAYRKAVANQPELPQISPQALDMINSLSQQFLKPGDN